MEIFDSKCLEERIQKIFRIDSHEFTLVINNQNNTQEIIHNL